MRLVLLLALAGCKTGGTPTATTEEITYHRGGAVVEDDVYKPSYDKADLQRALATERSAEAAALQQLRALEERGDYDQLRTATTDLAVRRRFIASLAACDAAGQACPPRLDDPASSFDVEGKTDPKLDAPLRFDLASWQQVASELHGRACACRTVACVDSMFGAIDRLETRPMPDVQADDAASLSIMRARECLYHLRGLRPTPRAIAAEP